MTKWEYQHLSIAIKDYSVSDELSERLNAMGKEGWELVSFHPTGGNMVVAYYQAVFKRPLK